MKKLHNILRVHYIDVQRAFLGEGNFMLTENFKKFAVSDIVWEEK